MQMPLKSIEQAYHTNFQSEDTLADKNSLSKKSLGEILLKRAMENDVKIEHDAELMQKLANMEQSGTFSRKYDPIIDKIVNYVNKSTKLNEMIKEELISGISEKKNNAFVKEAKSA